MTAPARRPLSESLPGTWQLVSRIDMDDSGRVVPEPTLGSDPVALFMLDRSGHFSAQFMRREPPDPDAATSRADARRSGCHPAHVATRHSHSSGPKRNARSQATESTASRPNSVGAAST